MKTEVSTSKETRHIESTKKVVIDMGDGYILTVEDQEHETTVTMMYPDNVSLELENITKPNGLDRDG